MEDAKRIRKAAQDHADRLLELKKPRGPLWIAGITTVHQFVLRGEYYSASELLNEMIVIYEKST